MIHYHGMPITPATAAVSAIGTGHAFVSFANKDQLGIAVSVCQSFAIDNGAFSAWRNGNPVTDWNPFYDFAERCRRIPNCDFAVIPDVIDGDEDANDNLLEEWPLPIWFGAPVWHFHESLDRLQRLVVKYPRICLGSSGDFSVVGAPNWWRRVCEAMEVICNIEGEPTTKVHGLRMLDPEIFSRLPLSSADSTNIGRNIGIDKHWKGTYNPPTKEARASIIRQRIESINSPATWSYEDLEFNHKNQLELI